MMDDVRLSSHFTLAEFCNPGKYPANVPSTQQTANIIYGCRLLLEPAREAIGCPIIITSGFRPPRHDVRLGYYSK